MMKKVIIIGSGFAGLSAACFLAKAGCDVTVIEKHDQPGGRARAFSAQGFTFDMGPSWYWMPDVFERFFASFDTKSSSFYELVRLDPSYQVIWEKECLSLPADYSALRSVFEEIEKGAAERLDAFMHEAKYKYQVSMDKLVYMPGLSVKEFFTKDVMGSVLKMDIFSSVHKHVRKYFSDSRLLQITEFPILFLGALPKNTPALYSLMNYADMKLGTWYPMGGMVQIVNAMYKIATTLDVKFRFDEQVEEIVVTDNKINCVKTQSRIYSANHIVAACDYAHAEQLLPEAYRNYNGQYWEERNMSPSSLLYYIGVNKKIEGLLHHNLFFDTSFEQHSAELYTSPKWPEDPLMYVCCPSKTDPGVAPIGCENLFILIPVAPGLKDTDEIKEQYFHIAMDRIEQRMGISFRDNIVYKRSYAGSDFISDYNSYKGNAYGLANTLMQTAILKPSIRNKKLLNMYYTGQLTVPGPGVPPAIISGEIVAKQILKSETHK